MVVAEHGVDCFGELCVVGLVGAAAVNLKVLQLIASGLLTAEHDLAVACSTRACPLIRSAKVTSLAPQVCESMALGGSLSWVNSA